MLRNVELTSDVLAATREALSDEGIRIDEEVDEDDDDVTTRRHRWPSP